MENFEFIVWIWGDVRTKGMSTGERAQQRRKRPAHALQCESQIFSSFQFGDCISGSLSGKIMSSLSIGLVIRFFEMRVLCI